MLCVLCFCVYDNKSAVYAGRVRNGQHGVFQLGQDEDNLVIGWLWGTWYLNPGGIQGRCVSIVCVNFYHTQRAKIQKRLLFSKTLFAKRRQELNLTLASFFRYPGKKHIILIKNIKTCRPNDSHKMINPNKQPFLSLAISEKPATTWNTYTPHNRP